MGKRIGFHWSDLQDDAKVRPVRWPDEFCEKCHAPDCRWSGLTITNCPFHKAEIERGKK